MTGDRESGKPSVLGVRSIGLAVAGHIAAFLLLYFFALLHLRPKEAVIPIDLTVVVNENLDGEENEPPPLSKPEPAPEQPKPPEPPQTPPPKVEDKIDAVEQVVEKKKPDPPKEKPKEEKKPDPPKSPEKTKEEREKERLKKMEQMRQSAKLVKIEVKNKPSGNGRTEQRTLSQAEIQKLLNQGYKPGTKNQISNDSIQIGVSLVKRALDERWRQMSPQIGAEGVVVLSIRFDGAGRIVESKLVKSSGDRLSDNAAYSVVRSISRIDHLPVDFLSMYSKEPLPINYRVENK